MSAPTTSFSPADLARAEDPHALLEVMPHVALADEPLRWRHTGLFRSLAALPAHPHGRGAECTR